MIIVLGALTTVGIIAALVDTCSCGISHPRSGRGPLLLLHTTQAADGPTTTRPGTWSCGSYAGSGCC